MPPGLNPPKIRQVKVQMTQLPFLTLLKKILLTKALVGCFLRGLYYSLYLKYYFVLGWSAHLPFSLLKCSLCVFSKIKFWWRHIFENSINHKPSLGSREVTQKFGPDRFSRFDVYWNKQTPRQAKFIYRCTIIFFYSIAF